MLVQSRSESNKRTNTLPAGREAINFQLNCITTAFDSLNARSNLNVTVTVNQKENINLEEISEGLKGDIETGFATGDLDTVKNSVSNAATTSINVDCKKST